VQEVSERAVRQQIPEGHSEALHGAYRGSTTAPTAAHCTSDRVQHVRVSLLQTCAAGRYQTITGTVTEDSVVLDGIPCKDCKTGTYQTEPGSPFCKKCEQGKWGDTDVPNSKAEHCVMCEQGRFKLSWSKPRDPCTSCEAGKYMPFTGAYTPCYDCKYGQFQQYKAQARCQMCALGKHGAKKGVNQTSSKYCIGSDSPKSVAAAAVLAVVGTTLAPTAAATTAAAPVAAAAAVLAVGGTTVAPTAAATVAAPVAAAAVPPKPASSAPTFSKQTASEFAAEVLLP
jgi:hypothetical protein